MFELDLLFRIVGSEVVEEDLGPGDLGVLVVDRVHLEEREVAFAFLGRPDLAGDRVAGPDIEPPYLGRRYIDVVGAGQIIVVRRPQESEPVREDLKHALSEDHAVLLGLRLQDGEDQLLLAHAADAFDLQIVGHRREFGDAFPFQFY